MDLDPLAIGFVALYILIGIAVVVWYTHNIELHGWDYLYAVGIVYLWPLVLGFLLVEWAYLKMRERMRI